MQNSLKSLYTSRAVLAIVAVVCVATLTTYNRAQEVSSFVQPKLAAQFQYSTLTGTTSTINATMVPVTNSIGAIAYENLTIPFVVTEDESGKLHVTAGIITVVPAPQFEANGFLAGNYVGPGGGTNLLITLSGPGVTAGGATVWSISTSPGATGCTYPTSAMFYVGPLTSNPLYPRLKAAEITSTAYSYGIEGQQACNPPDQSWDTGGILGFSQTGNTLTIVSFSKVGAYDSNTPYDQVTYTLIPPQ